MWTENQQFFTCENRDKMHVYHAFLLDYLPTDKSGKVKADCKLSTTVIFGHS